MLGKSDKLLEGQSRSVLQVILVLGDPDRQEVLLQRRGSYKRLFPGKLTVSASCRWPGDETWRESAEKAVLDEVGIRIGPSRLKLFEEDCPRKGFLMSYTFEALTEEEEKALAREAQSSRSSPEFSGMKLEYDATKACLDLFTVDLEKPCQYDLYPRADEITRRTKVPLMYPVFEHTEHHLAWYLLDEKETALIRDAITRSDRLRAELPAALETAEDPDRYHRALKELDTDTLVPLHWRVLHDALQGGTGGPLAPADFALDMAPIFLGEEGLYKWLELSLPHMVDVDHPAARLLSVAGGKGSNLHILRKLAGVHPRLFDVPSAEVVTVASYEQNVLQAPNIRELIGNLDQEEEEARRVQIAEHIQELICAIPICEPLASAIKGCCERLGTDTLMVRSSATVEDLKEVAAASHGRSFLVKGAADMINKVKEVWASLFTKEFVKLRWEHKGTPGFKNVEARMAVVVQKAIKPIAAGVVTSIEARGMRPVFTITAKPGFGGTVVDARGNVDKWHVGILGDVILERDIRIKCGIQDLDPERLLVDRSEQSTEPSLRDEDVLAVARACRQILVHYREHKLAENIDVEFAVGDDCRVHVVQARSEHIAGRIEGSDGKRSVRIRTVDPACLPAGVHPIAPEDKALCACPGAATAPLQVIMGEMDFDLAKNGAILVTRTYALTDEKIYDPL
jgi:hypothetical protein